MTLRHYFRLIDAIIDTPLFSFRLRHFDMIDISCHFTLIDAIIDYADIFAAATLRYFIYAISFLDYADTLFSRHY
jgi:hypothetical protein